MAVRAVITQNVLDFTVQVRAAGAAVASGAGVVVSPEGHVLTCDHVLTSDADVQIVLPAGVAHGRPCVARVIERDPVADLAVLQIVSDDLAVPDKSVAKVGASQDSQMHRFLAFGFPALGDITGGWASGYILGPVPGPTGPRFPPVQLDSAQVARGMSGSPVLDVRRNLVVALISDTWVPDGTGKHRDTAWATDLANLAGLRTPIEVRCEDLPPRSARPAASVPAVSANATPGVDLRAAPPPLALLRGRESMLAQITDDDRDGAVGIVSLVGFAGQGKSSLARAWVDGVVERRGAGAGILWWSFDDNADLDEFFGRALCRFADTGAMARRDVEALATRPDRGAVLASLVASGPHLVVLDGVEAVLLPARAGGRLPPALGMFVRELATRDGATRCLLTSRFPVLDLVDIGSHRHHPVGPLTAGQARSVLHDRGVHGRPDDLDRLSDQLDHHPLALVLAGSLIAERHGGAARGFTTLAALADGAGGALDRLDRILDEYQAALSAEQRCLLQVLGVQRVPLPRRVLDRIARGRSSRGVGLLHPLAGLTATAYDASVEGLVTLGLVLQDREAGTLSCHAVVKARFAATLDDEPADRRRGFHLAIAQALAWNLKGTTYAWLGLGAAVAAGLVVTRQFNPAPITAVVQAARNDDLLAEVAYFLRRSRAT